MSCCRSMTATPASTGESAFEQALGRYQRGEPTAEVLADFRLELLDDQPLQALRSARFAVKLSPQDPQARINLSLAMLETNAKGVREHIELVQRMRLMAPELAAELDNSIADGLVRKSGWKALEKVKAWLTV